MQKQEVVTGIIGFFDILGYQSFLLNNEPETAAEEVFDTLTGIDRIVKGHIAKVFPDSDTWLHDSVQEKIKWLVFSDTILITIDNIFITSLPQPDRIAMSFENTLTAIRGWITFLLVSAVLQRHMFEFGLPLRGAITTGKFIVKGNSFAGRPIIEGYQLSQNIDLAATIFSPSAYEELCQVIQHIDEVKKDQESNLTSKLGRENLIDVITLKYLVPFKTMPPEPRITLNFLAISTPDQKPAPDLAQMVFDAFWKHNKDIPPDAITKVRNTEQYLRFLKHKRPTIFQH